MNIVDSINTSWFSAIQLPPPIFFSMGWLCNEFLRISYFKRKPFCFMKTSSWSSQTNFACNSFWTFFWYPIHSLFLFLSLNLYEHKSSCFVLCSLMCRHTGTQAFCWISVINFYSYSFFWITNTKNIFCH